MYLAYALVRRPSPIMDQGQLTHLEKSDFSYDLAVSQWENYCEILSRYTEVIEVDATPDLPDSVFVEDTVFTYGNVAVRTNMHPSRQAEQDSVVGALAARGFEIVELPADARLEGGDILKFGEKVWVGRSTRSNMKGAVALSEILGPQGVDVMSVPVEHALHLKSCLTALPDGTFISHVGYAPPATHFPGLRYVPEFLGTQVVLLGGNNLLISASAPMTANYLRSLGFEVVECEMSEIEKMEGSVTCLSVRIRR